MILITSAAFVSDDLVAELGKTPPSFLPIGNRRLYEYQLRFFSECDDKILISVPETYSLEKTDARKLNQAGVSVVYVPEGLSLGASISFVLERTKRHRGSTRLQILHGDTLISEHEFAQENCASVARNRGYYGRAVVQKNNGNCQPEGLYTQLAEEDDLVLSGYFSFSNTRHFHRCLVEAKYDFIKAIRQYGEKHSINFQECDNWLDFGHLNNFFRSRAKITTQRSFNSLLIAENKVTKSSSDHEKISAEYKWLSDIPSEIKLHAPRVLEPFTTSDKNISGYSLEYLYLLPLSDLFVYANHSQYTWGKIFKACHDFLEKCRSFRDTDSPKIDLRESISKKTEFRLKEFATKTGFNLDKELVVNGIRQPSLQTVSKRSLQQISQNSLAEACVSHGDFCMSNILYDFRAQSIKILDPRGLNFDGKFSKFGDQRYDYAKLHHSVIGLYDFIVAERYVLGIQDRGHILDFKIEVNNDTKKIQEQYVASLFRSQKISEKEILAITIQLFLSMLPLHSDSFERQCAFIANGIRLYENLFSETHGSHD